MNDITIEQDIQELERILENYFSEYYWKFERHAILSAIEALRAKLTKQDIGKMD